MRFGDTIANIITLVECTFTGVTGGHDHGGQGIRLS